MTNLSPYRLGHIFEYKDSLVILLAMDTDNTYEDGAAPSTFYIERDDITSLEEVKEVPTYDFETEAVLKEITLEFLSELAREKGEGLVIRFLTEDCIITVSGKSTGCDLFEKDPNETLGEFALRVAKLRNYLS